MSDEMRKSYTEALFPLYKNLIESDEIPNDFSESMLITGLTASAKKQVNLQSNFVDEKSSDILHKNEIINKELKSDIEKEKVLALVCPQVGAISETFYKKAY